MSQVGYGPPVRLDGPLPQKRSFTLLDVATIVPELDEHWLNGARILPYPGDTGHVHDPCATGSPATKNAGTLPESPHFGAFTGYLPVTCTSFSVGADAAWFKARAFAAFAAIESTIAERVFATGEGLDALQPHLTDSNLTQLNAGAATGAMRGTGGSRRRDRRNREGGRDPCHPERRRRVGFGGRPGTTRQSTCNRERHPGRLRCRIPRGLFPTVVPHRRPGVRGRSRPAPSRRDAPTSSSPPTTTRKRSTVQSTAVEFFAERSMLIDWDAVLQAGVLVDRSL